MRLVTRHQNAARAVFLSAALLLPAASSLPLLAAAQENFPERVCSGFDFQRGIWGTLPETDAGWYYCPRNFAVFGAYPQLYGTDRGSADIEITANCCPLPADDILTDEHVSVDYQCPENFIVTGMFRLGRKWSGSELGKKPLRCTRVNTDKYALAPEKNGLTWGASSAVAFPWKGAKVRVDEVPPALRYGLARVSRGTFRYVGCAGDPIGSLLTAKITSGCSGLRWRRLYYKPPVQAGEALLDVKMFPDCRWISSPFEKEPQCLR